MRILLLLLLLTAFANTHSWAKTYSCRDSQGKMHFADNLQGLPSECLGKEKVIKPDKPDNLNYVPATKDPSAPGIKFQHSVRDAEREQQRKQVEKRQLHSRAEKLLERYQEALAEKRRAKRSWSYSSRDIIKSSDQTISGVKADKELLLEELNSARVGTEEKTKIEQVLSGIK